jgi:hypothetical protein
VLESCAWLYSFERLCLVCERPQEVQQSAVGKGRNKAVTSTIRWRDGTESVYTQQD